LFFAARQGAEGNSPTKNTGVLISLQSDQEGNNLGRIFRDARNFSKIEKRAVIKLYFTATQGAEGNSPTNNTGVLISL
jgi:hypothetical protein